MDLLRASRSSTRAASPPRGAGIAARLPLGNARSEKRPGNAARSSLLFLVLLGVSSALAARSERPSVRDLKKLSIEELTALDVTSVSRTGESLRDAAAAIAVVTNEDIRRSGATSVPEALRLVPGLHVARRHASSWAVSSRGFSSVNSEKLLVLTDTRSVYTPLFSGVAWDVQDLFLEDIERIEVIRGPGASLWGSNAVNGVISITTRSSADTQGLYLETAAGDETRAVAGVRYGGKIAGGIHYRLFGKYHEQDSTFNPDPATSDDGRLGHVGFRADWDAGTADAFTLQGDAYRGNCGQNAPAIEIIGRPGAAGDLEAGVSGGNVLGRWRRSLGPSSDMELRAYYDRTHRDDPSFTDDLDTADVDFQHRFAPGGRQEILWGLSYRHMSNRNAGRGIFADGLLRPGSSSDQVVSGFVQDHFDLTDAVRLTLGTKLEHNDFSGFEVQPTVRAAWSPMGGHTAWTAISRAVRVPTRLERDVLIDASDPAGSTVVRLTGNEDFDAEVLLAYEAGYRWQASENLFIDLAAFHNRYDRLASLEAGTPTVDPVTGQTIIPVINRNLTEGRSQGAEALITFSPVPGWRLSAVYSYVDLELEALGLDLNRGEFLEGATPRHQLGLRSSLDLPAGFQVDAQLRSLSAVRSNPQLVSGEGLAGYSELDLRIAWRASEKLEISLVGQNLLDVRHPEFGTPADRGEIERSIYGKAAWAF